MIFQPWLGQSVMVGWRDTAGASDATASVSWPLDDSHWMTLHFVMSFVLFWFERTLGKHFQLLV